MGGSFFFMPRNQISPNELKAFVEKLKIELGNENISSDIKSCANKYLNRVLDRLEQYRY
jgi:hypothetical protein